MSKTSATHRHVRYAGLAVPLIRRWWHNIPHRKFDKYRDMPTYEAALLEGLNRTVSEGDKVVVVGAGFGVTVAVSSKLVGSDGTVQCFEGSSNCLSDTRATLALNGLGDNVTLTNAIVGTNISVYKSEAEAPVIAATDLPDCDVLELDCEGAEIKILSEMTIRPKSVLVETHGTHGAPTATVKSILQTMGYTVELLGVAEPYLEAYCREKDIMVLMAVRD